MPSLAATNVPSSFGFAVFRVANSQTHQSLEMIKTSTLLVVNSESKPILNIICEMNALQCLKCIYSIF
jgi:hypothetical protein